MGTYSVQFSCGHSQDVRLHGRRRDREYYISRAGQSGKCSACEEQERKDRIARIEAEFELPELQGTDKQISWARSIRAFVVGEFQRLRFDMSQTDIMAVLGIDEAGWWIDHRETRADELPRLADEHLLLKAKIAEPAVDAAPAHILRPSDTPVTATPIVVTIKPPFIELTSHEYHKPIVTIARDFRGEWQRVTRGSGYWVIKTDPLSGDPLHVAADLVSQLVAKGFIVSLDHDGVRNLVETGTFTPAVWRHVRMVLSRRGRLMAHISWPLSDDLYRQAKSLPGALYVNRAVQVPVIAIESVADFAERYGFALSPATRRAIERHAAALANGGTAETAMPRGGASDESKDLVVPEDYDIHEALRDF
ncbi:hypothetical protein [Pannonibacter tanglangensis]|uniref:Uncharacterized protein n=1 Tax=Pannonibacter tanglangensis TaxID=2750084 RepID=A0ABW9ZD33_9HYPH|nr:hypothetical protein [Pannonibacter sp. XCT-34]NBN62755.1 hypothetical protein [Pannonibacter sp. XCT-34]